MKINNRISDDAVLEELGKRIRERRGNEQLSQARLAENAGVGRSTVERLEKGKSVELVKLIRILRVLNMLEVLENALPEIGPRPMDLVNQNEKFRKRAAKTNIVNKVDKTWQWGDEK